MAFSEQSLAQARQQGYSDDEIFDHIARSDERFSVAKQQGYSLDDIAAHLKQKEGGVNYEDATSQSGQGPLDNRNEERAVQGEVQAGSTEGAQADSMLPAEDQSQFRSDEQARVTTGVPQGGELIEGQTKDAQGGIQGQEEGQGLRGQVSTGNEAQVIAPQQAAMQAAPFGAEGVQPTPAKEKGIIDYTGEAFKSAYKGLGTMASELQQFGWDLSKRVNPIVTIAKDAEAVFGQNPFSEKIKKEIVEKGDKYFQDLVAGSKLTPEEAQSPLNQFMFGAGHMIGDVALAIATGGESAEARALQSAADLPIWKSITTKSVDGIKSFAAPSLLAANTTIDKERQAGKTDTEALAAGMKRLVEMEAGAALPMQVSSGLDNVFLRGASRILQSTPLAVAQGELATAAGNMMASEADRRPTISENIVAGNFEEAAKDLAQVAPMGIMGVAGGRTRQIKEAGLPATAAALESTAKAENTMTATGLNNAASSRLNKLEEIITGRKIVGMDSNGRPIYEQNAINKLEADKVKEEYEFLKSNPTTEQLAERYGVTIKEGITISPKTQKQTTPPIVSENKVIELPQRPSESDRNKVKRKLMSGEELTSDENLILENEKQFVSEVQNLEFNSDLLSDTEVFKIWKSARNVFSTDGLLNFNDSRNIKHAEELHDFYLNQGNAEEASRIRNAIKSTSRLETNPKNIIENAKSRGEEISEQEANDISESNKTANQKLDDLSNRLDQKSKPAEAPAEAQPTKPSEAKIAEAGGIPTIERKPVEPEATVEAKEGVAPREGEGEEGQVAPPAAEAAKPEAVAPEPLVSEPASKEKIAESNEAVSLMEQQNKSIEYNVKFAPSEIPTLKDARAADDLIAKKGHTITISGGSKEGKILDRNASKKEFEKVGYERQQVEIPEDFNKKVSDTYGPSISNVKSLESINWLGAHFNGGLAISPTLKGSDRGRVLAHEFGHASHSLLGDKINKNPEVLNELKKIEQELYPGLRDKVSTASNADIKFFNYLLSPEELIAEFNVNRIINPERANQVAPVLSSLLESVQADKNLVKDRKTFPTGLGSIGESKKRIKVEDLSERKDSDKIKENFSPSRWAVELKRDLIGGLDYSTTIDISLAKKAGTSKQIIKKLVEDYANDKAYELIKKSHPDIFEQPVEPVVEFKEAVAPEGSRVASAAYLAPDGNVYEGKSHIEAMEKAKEAGAITQERIDAKQSAESRNTGEFGYVVTRPDGTRTPTTREAAGKIAKRSGQALKEQFDFVDKMHSNEVALDDFAPKAEAPTAPQAEPTFIQKAESWADSVIKESSKRVSTGLDPEVLAAYAVKGSIVIGRGVRNFGVWSGEMVKQFGEEIRPHLKDIWSRAKSYAEDEAKIQMDTKDYIQRREEAVAGGGPTVMRGVSERLAEQAGEGTAKEYYIQADELVRRKSLSDVEVMEWTESLTPEQAKAEYERAIFAPASDEKTAAVKVKLAARRLTDLEAAGDDAGYAQVVNEVAREITVAAQVLRDARFLYKATPKGFTTLLEKVAESKNIKIKPEKIAEIEAQFKDFTEAGKRSEAKELEVLNAKSEKEFNAALKDLEKLRKEGFKKQNALDKTVGGIWPKSGREELIPTLLRGNFLTTMSIAVNAGQNMLKGTFLDVTQKLIKSQYSKVESLLTGKEPKYVFGLEQAARYYATLAKESPELVRNLFRTVLRQPLPADKPVNIMEIRSSLNPIAAIRRLKGIYNKESLQYEGDYGFKEAVKDSLEATTGLTADVFFDLLTATDRPFRQAVMISEASGMATRLGLKGLEKEKFLKLPQKGIEKWARENIKDPAKRAEEIKNLKQELADAVSESLGEAEVTIGGKNVTRGVSNFLNKIAKSNPITSLLVYSNAPYVRFPLNFAVNAFKLSNPELAAVSFFYNAARGNSKKAAIDFSIMASGVALAYAGKYLYDQGVIQTTDSPQTKAQKLSGELGRAGSINLSKLKRIVNGETSDTMPGDKIQRLDRLGLIGVGVLAEADKQEALKKKKLLTGDVSFADALVTRMAQLPVSLSYTMNQTFAKGVAGLVDALTQGEDKAEKFLKNTFAASLSIVMPNELSAISRYISDYTPNLDDPKFMKTLENAVRQRMGMTADLPVKRGFWGEKVPSTPEGANPIAYHFFDFTKQRKLPSVPATMEIIRLFEKTQDNRIIPSEVQDKITIKGSSYRLSAKDHERYQELVGAERLNRVNKLIDSRIYQSASIDRKADRFSKAIDRGARMGERKFLQELQKSGREAGEVLKIPRKELIRRIAELEKED